MFTLRQIRDTLELLVEHKQDAEAAALLPYVARRWDESPDNDHILFEVPAFFDEIAVHISSVLDSFTRMSTRVHGLTIAQIGAVMDRHDEPWPDYVIAAAMQLRLLANENKLYHTDAIMEMEFAS